MSDSEDVESPEEALLSKHRKEKKELQVYVSSVFSLISDPGKSKTP